MRRCTLGLLALVLLLSLVGCASGDPVMTIDVADAVVQSITVTSDNLPQPVSTDGSRIDVVNIEHGIYTICVRYDDGAVLWMEYLHSDAGRRRQVQVKVTGGPSEATVNVEQTANGRPLFEGNVDPGSTSLMRPFRLAWI